MPRSWGVSGWTISRARGPQIPKQAYCEVTSWTCTEWRQSLLAPSLPLSCRRIHSRSWLPKAVPVTIEKLSSASRATVKSHSIPPRLFSICV